MFDHGSTAPYTLGLQVPSEKVFGVGLEGTVTACMCSRVGGRWIHHAGLGLATLAHNMPWKLVMPMMAQGFEDMCHSALSQISVPRDFHIRLFNGYPESPLFGAIDQTPLSGAQVLSYTFKS